MKYPYRVGEVPLKSVKNQKTGTKFSRITLNDPNLRKPTEFSMGVHLENVALQQPDPTCSLSLATGAQARVCAVLPEPNKAKFELFKKWCYLFFKKNFEPLAPDTDIDPFRYLQSRPYSEKKKKQMWDDWTKQDGVMKEKDWQFGIFCKKENYVKYSHSRVINSPSDIAKLRFGPVIAKIEEVVYKKKWFIKKVPVPQRPAFLMKMKENLTEKIDMTDSDFSSFECSFTSYIKEGIEFVFLWHMIQHLPGAVQYMADFRRWCGGSMGTTLRNKNFRIHMADVSRFSGELTTSLFNGLTNVCIHEYFAHITEQFVEFIVEGDDCLALWSKIAPSVDYYRELGFDVTIGYHQGLETTSFCGQVFHMDDLTVMTDPRYVLAGTGWLPYEYAYARKGLKMGLLRAKAFSVGYQYQATPILSAFANYLLRVTKSYDMRVALDRLDSYKKEQLEEAMKHPLLLREPRLGSRHLMQQLYGVDLMTQYKYEDYFNNCNELKPIPNLFSNIEPSWCHYYEHYVHEVELEPEFVNFPPEDWPVTPQQVAIKFKARIPASQKYIDARTQKGIPQ